MTATAVFSEAQLEEAVLEILTEMGYETAFGPEISVDGTYPNGRIIKMYFCGIASGMPFAR